jgi:Holliday junction resolvase RusA-like endonuclease
MRIYLNHLPPSVNSIYANVAGRGRIKAARYKEWINAVGWTVNPQLSKDTARWTGPVKITVGMIRPRENSDLDNRLKALDDLLQTFGIVSNDKLIYHWDVQWVRHLPGPAKVEITIKDHICELERRAA